MDINKEQISRGKAILESDLLTKKLFNCYFDNFLKIPNDILEINSVAITFLTLSNLLNNIINTLSIIYKIKKSETTTFRFKFLEMIYYSAQELIEDHNKD